MKYVDDLDELQKLLEESQENIVYPIREEGAVFLDYFRYTNKLYHQVLKFSKFICLVKENMPFGASQYVIQDLPVIPLRNLVHFRETANFFVVAPDNLIEEISDLLNNFNCRNIFIITGNIISQIKVKLEEFKKSGYITDWYLNYFMREISSMKHLITSQNEISFIHTKSFEEYRNAFRDKKIVIVATGPTLKYYKPVNDAIHIGLNFAWRNENIDFDFLFTQDNFINQKNNHKVEEGFEKIRERIFVGRYSYSDEWFRYSENYSFMKDNIRRFCLHESSPIKTIYQDICHYPISDFNSVSFSALHFALFTYPKEIYLVGCDTTPSGHFYDKKNSGEKATNSDMLTGVLKVGYARMKMFAEQYYPDTKIISINPVGLKGLFEDIYTDEYKKEMEF